MIWLLEDDLNTREHSPESLEASFAVFKQVKKQLLEKRKAGGFFSVGVGKGKNKGKGMKRTSGGKSL